MKVTSRISHLVNTLPGYRQWAFRRAVNRFSRSKAQLLTAAQAPLVYNATLGRKVPTYAPGVQALIDHYDRELERLYTKYHMPMTQQAVMRTKASV